MASERTTTALRRFGLGAALAVGLVAGGVGIAAAASPSPSPSPSTTSPQGNGSSPGATTPHHCPHDSRGGTGTNSANPSASVWG